jgi:hypothetical protein
MGAMKEHRRLVARSWMLAMGAVLLIATHAMVLRFALPHKGLSAAVIAGVMLLVAIKHLGLLSPLYASLRRLSRR